MRKKDVPLTHEEKVQLKRRIVSLISIIFFIMILVIAGICIGKPMIKLLKNPDSDAIKNYFGSFGIYGRIVFIGMAAIQVVLAIIPGGPVQVAAGMAFGVVEGSILCLVGIEIGSSIAFLLVRMLGYKAIDPFYPKEKIEKLKFLQNSKKMNIITFFLFLIPGSPKDLLTYFYGLTKMKYPIFLLITSLARLPLIIMSVIGGNTLGSGKYLIAIIVFSAMLIISLIGAFIYRRYVKNKS